MLKKSHLVHAAVMVWAGACASSSAWADNWFDIQTIALPEWGYGKLLGFIQPVFTDIQASPASNHQIPKPDLVGPTAQDSTDLYVQRARVFVRGSMNPDVSYYVGSELGENAYTYSFGNYGPKLIDANITVSNKLPGGNRFEIGIIRAPSAETAMEGYMDFNFLDSFPTGITQLMQPVFYSRNVQYASTVHNGYLVPGTDLSGNNGFRYPGVQLENWFMVAPHTEVAYGAMLGEYGRQFESSTQNGPIAAARLQFSYLLGPEKPARIFRNDITGFVWYQQARPELNGVSNTMVRDGFGVAARDGYLKQGARSMKLEFYSGTGNIEAPAVYNEVPGVAPAQYDATFYPGSENRAYGYTGSLGYFVTDHVEAVLRYDAYDRLPNLAAQERLFQTAAAAVEYHFTPFTRLVVDYEDHRVTIPNPTAIGKPGSAPLTLAETTVDAIGNQVDIYAVLAF